MYEYDLGRGGGVKCGFEKKTHREQDYAISNPHWVCKFGEMGWDIMFLRKRTRENVVLCRILVGWGCNSIQNWAERYAGRLLCKNRNVFGCKNNNKSGFFFKKVFLFFNEKKRVKISSTFQTFNHYQNCQNAKSQYMLMI